MENHITLIFCVCDDCIRSINYQDRCNVTWLPAEAMTFWVVAMKHFHGLLNTARIHLLKTD